MRTLGSSSHDAARPWLLARSLDRYTSQSLPSMPLRTFCWAVAWILASQLTVSGQPPDSAPPAVREPARWAILIEGLPGDEEHAALFQSTTRAWRDWLTQDLEFAAEHVLVCRGAAADEAAGTHPATREALAAQFQTLAAQAKPEDGLWVFVLGHGDLDGPSPRLHVPGPDPDVADLAEWLTAVPCREQLVWLTQSCSGEWLPRLSRAGRIVITATAESEVNETEFPHALTTVMRKKPRELDVNSDERVTFDELLAEVVAETLRRFETDQRLPTEHAQFDDNGDAHGTELGPADPNAAPPPTKIEPDGKLSRATGVPYRAEAWQPIGESEGTPPAAGGDVPAAR